MFSKFIFIAAAFISVVSPMASAQTTLLSLDASKFQYKTNGNAVGAGWVLATNGYIENTLSVPANGSYQFQIQAFGPYAGNAWPRMEVRVDQKVVGAFSVASSTSKTYSLTTSVTGGAHKIEIAFTNDYYASGQDRNLSINHLNVLTTVSTTTTTTLPTTTTTWLRCAAEAGTCNFTGTKVVRYGANGIFATKTLPGPVACNNTTFGDPVYGVNKYCDYSSDATTVTTTTLPTTTTTTILPPPTTTTTTLPTTSGTGGSAGPTISTFRASGPITLVSGQVVTGLAISNPNGPCILGNNISNVHIYNNKIGPCGPNTNDAAVQITGGHDITVDHNSMDNIVAAFFANSSSNNLVFDHNYVTRIKNAFPRAQMVQMAQTTGSGIRITCNVSDQTTPGFMGGPEDQINMYKTFGTAASPIQIKYNKIRGGGPSNSGGGILAGDESSSYITIEKNILVNPGQYGIGVAGGHDNRVLNNKIYSSSFSWVNVGIYVWNQYAASCYGNEVSGNRVNWTDRSGRQYPWENGNNCGPIAMTGNTLPDMTISSAIWNEVIPECN
jgi:parallel beta-helix repeat protein